MIRSYLIEGRVQGVGFRYFVAREAARLGITGWVLNLPDGRVEVKAEGEAEPVLDLESAVRKGPPHSWVITVECHEISDEGTSHKVFEIK